ncbi:unnamed protein product [Calypogeia fissa]
MAMRERRPTHLQNGYHHDMQNGLQNGEHVARQQKRGIFKRAVAWVNSKIYVYNVTFGLYMLDWWERVLFNVLALLLLWFLCYTTSDFLIRSFKDPGSAFQGWAPSWFRRESINSDG